MRSNASTQTVPGVAPLADLLLDDDPLVLASDAILTAVRRAEQQILAALGLPRTRLRDDAAEAPFAGAFSDPPPRSSAAPAAPPSHDVVTLAEEPAPSAQRRARGSGSGAVSVGSAADAAIDQLRFRLAAVVDAAMREAEDEVLQRLGAIAALVPDGEGGVAYTQVRLSPSRREALAAQEAQLRQRRRVLERVASRSGQQQQQQQQQQHRSPEGDSRERAAAATGGAARSPPPAAAKQRRVLSPPLRGSTPDEAANPQAEELSGGSSHGLRPESALVQTPRRGTQPSVRRASEPTPSAISAETAHRVRRLQRLADSLLPDAEVWAPAAPSAPAAPAMPHAGRNPLTVFGGATSPLRSRRAQSYAAQLDAILRAAGTP